jgi:hypothetical protein
MTIQSKKIIITLKKNKEKILLFLAGYFLFIIDTNFVKNASNILENVQATYFFISYAIFLALTFLSVKVFLKRFPNIKYERKPFSIFILISIGSLFGFLTNMMNAHVITTFNRFLF